MHSNNDVTTVNIHMPAAGSNAVESKEPELIAAPPSQTRSSGEYSFFREIQRSIHGCTPLPLDVSGVVSEYIASDHHFLSKVRETSLAIQEAIRSTGDEKNLQVDVLVKILTDNIEKLVNIINLVAANPDQIELSSLSPKMRAAAIELATVPPFLTSINLVNPDTFCEMDTNRQLQIYALKSRIEICFEEQAFIELFGAFFSAILPLLTTPQSIGCQLTPWVTLGPCLYNNFVLCHYEKFVLPTTYNQENYQTVLSEDLESKTDMAQLVTLDHFYGENRKFFQNDEEADRNYFQFLSAHPQKDLNVSAAVIVTMGKHGVRLLSADGQLSAPYTLFSVEDLFQLICKASNLDCMRTAEYIGQFTTDFVGYLLKNYGDNFSVQLFNKLTFSPKIIFDKLLMAVAGAILQAVHKMRPDLSPLLEPLRNTCLQALETLKSNEGLNPFCRQSNFFSDGAKLVRANFSDEGIECKPGS